MRIPKKVTICGKTYKVGKDSKVYGGKGSTSLAKITIGTKCRNSEVQFEIFVHEVMELVACERELRYGDGYSDGSIFVMSHKEFDNFSADVATAIRPMVAK